jgi:hypothetical protein
MATTRKTSTADRAALRGETLPKEQARAAVVAAQDVEVYAQIRDILTAARAKAYTAINFAMVEAYWLVGKQIVDDQAGNERAEYGAHLLKYLSEQLTRDFGKGFNESNLRYIRQFYLAFNNCDALRHELSWSHYRKIMKVENETARTFLTSA